MARPKKQIDASIDSDQFLIDKDNLNSLLTSVINKQFSKTVGQVSYDVSSTSQIDPTTVKN